MAVFSYIDGWCNPVRRHSGCGYLFPIACETPLAKETETTYAANRPPIRGNSSLGSAASRVALDVSPELRHDPITPSSDRRKVHAEVRRGSERRGRCPGPTKPY